MSSRPTFILPTIADVTACILSHWDSIHTEASDYAETDDADASDTYLDIRVWARSSNYIAYPSSWGFEVGDSSYDTVHGDICASDCIDLASPSCERTARAMARELVAELRSQRAEFQSVARGR